MLAKFSTAEHSLACMYFSFLSVVNHLLQRALWRHYFQQTEAVILVVDSNDRERIGVVREELDRLMAEDELRSVLLLVMANKQDLPNAMKPAEVSEELGLPKLRNRKWCKYWWIF